ncbi:hypothetical protein VNO80_24647 [Phaseolus coccineus]|uniref:Uncharacterized protein n=1 Tax=Phaseolus coccineus TaxID=3886 RepID=A0AAN9LST0_PHACN
MKQLGVGVKWRIRKIWFLSLFGTERICWRCEYQITSPRLFRRVAWAHVDRDKTKAPDLFVCEVGWRSNHHHIVLIEEQVQVFMAASSNRPLHNFQYKIS